jgi:ketosteroid isomerase-like protein
MGMTEKEQVEAAARRFYAAIETMIAGGGANALADTWHHVDDATGKHPSGEWSHGWDELWATWQVFASFGRPENGGSQLLSIRANVYGDFAYTTSVFQASPAWGGEQVMCTNILRRMDGAWKLIHHHADPSVAMQKALERMLDG